MLSYLACHVLHRVRQVLGDKAATGALASVAAHRYSHTLGSPHAGRRKT